jgi:hypothetical protein
MIPPFDMNTDLTPEERVLAQRLARLGPYGEPSPALDARILAAAHDAAMQAQTRRPRRRWPVAFGIAASLALAVGIAWQLRPLPQATAAYPSEAPAAASAPATPETAAIADATMESGNTPADASAIAQPADMATTRATPAPEAGREPAKAMKAAAPAPPPPAEPAAEPDVVFDSPAPAAAEAAAQSMPAVQAPRAFSPQPQPLSTSPAARDDRRNAATGDAAARADAAADALPETDTLDRLQATGTAEAASDEPDTDVPPATMTSPEARDAWLARIRELLAAGKPDAARASLREFMHRYPDQTLPDDLRALGQ